jgi:hypothetical protein
LDPDQEQKLFQSRNRNRSKSLRLHNTATEYRCGSELLFYTDRFLSNNTDSNIIKRQDFEQICFTPKYGLDLVPKYGLDLVPKLDPNPEQKQFQSRNRNRSKSLRFHNTATEYQCGSGLLFKTDV